MSREEWGDEFVGCAGDEGVVAVAGLAEELKSGDDRVETHLFEVTGDGVEEAAGDGCGRTAFARNGVVEDGGQFAGGLGRRWQLVKDDICGDGVVEAEVRDPFAQLLEGGGQFVAMLDEVRRGGLPFARGSAGLEVDVCGKEVSGGFTAELDFAACEFDDFGLERDVGGAGGPLEALMFFGLGLLQLARGGCLGLLGGLGTEARDLVEEVRVPGADGEEAASVCLHPRFAFGLREGRDVDLVAEDLELEVT